MSGLVDDLDTVGAIECELGVEGHLRHDDETAVHYAEGAQVDGHGGGWIEVSGGDFLVLGLEEVGKCWAVVTPAGLGPEAEFVVLGRLLWESVVESVSECSYCA